MKEGQIADKMTYVEDNNLSFYSIREHIIALWLYSDTKKKEERLLFFEMKNIQFIFRHIILMFIYVKKFHFALI